MKALCFVCLISILFVGCGKHRQTRRQPARVPAPTVASAPPADLQKAGNQSLLRATEVLEELTSTPADPVPDAVLTRAKCLVLSPAGSFELATVACRNGNSWGSPTFANLRGISHAPAGSAPVNRGANSKKQEGDLLIFVLSDRAQQALLCGRLNFQKDFIIGAGPMPQPGQIVTDVELKGNDGLAYLHKERNLAGVPISSGIVELNSAMSTRVYGRGGSPALLLQGKNPRSSLDDSFNVMVNSFFYLIRPSGIIIHHSVLVPESAVAEQALDDFHSKRGFSVQCFGRKYHVAYHYLVLPDGTIKAGRPERCQGAHSRGYNSFLGVALVGDFSSRVASGGGKKQLLPSAAQMQALLNLVRELRQRYKIPLHRIMRHSDISNTLCPGDRFLFSQFLAELDQLGAPGS
jgi:N-acetylmuramoyl-L-alanine amidase